MAASWEETQGQIEQLEGEIADLTRQLMECRDDNLRLNKALSRLTRKGR